MIKLIFEKHVTQCHICGESIDYVCEDLATKSMSWTDIVYIEPCASCDRGICVGHYQSAIRGGDHYHIVWHSESKDYDRNDVCMITGYCVDHDAPRESSKCQ